MGESQSSLDAKVDIAQANADRAQADAGRAQAEADKARSEAVLAAEEAKINGEIEKKKLEVQQANLAVKAREEELKKAKVDAEMKQKQRAQEAHLALQKAESEAGIALKERLAAEERARQTELHKLKVAQEKLDAEAKSKLALEHQRQVQEVEAAAARRKSQLRQEAEELALQELKNKELMMQPEHVENTLKTKTKQTFAEFDSLPGASVKKAEHVAVLSYLELQNKEKIIEQTKTLFAELPPEPKQQLLEAAANVVKVISDCTEMHSAVDCHKKEFTVQIPQIKKQITTRYCVCFNFSKMDEEIAKKSGLMSWLQGKSVQERTLVGIGYKLEMVTFELNPHGIGQEDASELAALGIF